MENDEFREKVERLESVPDELVSRTAKAQGDIYETLLKSLNKLEYKNGKLVLNSDNLTEIGRISKILNDAVFRGKYYAAISDFIKEIAEQGKITNSYFSKNFKDFTENDIYSEILKTAQRQTLKLLDEDAVASVLIEPLREKLTTAVVTGSSFGDLVTSLKTFITGNDDIPGALERHVKRIAYDSFAINDRNYTKVISDALDVKWFIYAGGVVEDTRPFCAKRHGNFYTKEQIMSWASKEWDGKVPGTNRQTIFTYAGGYNCKHSLMPVSESVVPKELIK